MRKTLAAVGVLSLLGATALAHSGATGVVKQRMDHMKGIGEATKAIGHMLQGKAEWKAERVRELAARIAGAGGEAIAVLFPEGSIRHPSEARPEIWENWERFTELAGQLRVRAAALAEGAGNPRDGSEASPERLFAAMAETCKGCHREFRVQK